MLSWVHWHNTSRLHGYLNDIPLAGHVLRYETDRPTTGEIQSREPHQNQGVTRRAARAGGATFDASWLASPPFY